MIKRFLVVDDMQQWQNFHIKAIQEIFAGLELDAEITTCDNATDALVAVLKNIKTPFDVIISDLQMELEYEPEQAGEWLIRNTKNCQEYSNTKMIIISGASDIKNIAEKLNVDYLSKNVIIHNKLAFKLKLDEILGR